MKKILFLIFLLMRGCLSFAQTVQHHSYLTHYNAALKEPDSVSWYLTPVMVGCVDQTRKDAFKQDPLIKDSAKPVDYAVNSDDKTSPKYNPDRASWIDEGHLFSYQDAICNDTDKKECFYMTNMLPQIHAFNAGDWKTLEVQEREWAKTDTLHIIAGGAGSKGKLPDGENIPAVMWKAIYMKGNWTVWIMPNEKTSEGHDYTYWQKTTAELDALTGLRL